MLFFVIHVHLPCRDEGWPSQHTRNGTVTDHYRLHQRAITVSLYWPGTEMIIGPVQARHAGAILARLWQKYVTVMGR